MNKGRAVARVCAYVIAVAAAVPAIGEETAALAGVRALAEINGQALACGPGDVARRAKALMLAHAPKTPAFADAFDAGTRRAFAAHVRGGAACPDASTLSTRLAAVEADLRTALPRAAAPASDDVAAPRATPRYLLEGPHGRAVTAEDFRGRFQLVTFGYTSCADVCPTTLLELHDVMVALGKRAAAVQPIFITVDPRRDVAVVREAYARNFDARIVALGGPEALVRRAADAFNVRYEKVQSAGAPADVYTMDHTAGVFLIAPDGTLAERFAYGTPVETLVARIEQWLDATAGQGR